MEAIQLAKLFAHSLDAEDYDSTAGHIAPTCEYEIAGRVYRGPEAIIASYRSSGNWAAQTLDGIRYESAIRSGERGEVVVEFVDHLEHAGKTLIHRSEQHLEFDDFGLISRIRHIDLPGERDALARFFESVGLSPLLDERENG